MSKRIYVVKVEGLEVREHASEPSPFYDYPFYYLQANSAGVVAEPRRIFRPDELVGNKNIQVVARYVPQRVKKPLFSGEERL